MKSCEEKTRIVYIKNINKTEGMNNGQMHKIFKIFASEMAYTD